MNESRESNYSLVTGASSGIGRAIAVRLSESRRLVLHGRDPVRLEETRALCSGTGHVIWSYDLARVETLQKEFEAFVLENGLAIESFVHSAGIAPIQAARAIDLNAIRQVMDVNATSAMLICASLVKKRIAQTTLKNIVFISSIAGQFGVRGFAVYGASKSALDAVMRSLAVELSPRIRVNSICLGAVSTSGGASRPVGDAVLKSMEKQYPLGVGVPSDAANVTHFLLSEEARWLTGQQIILDGGRTVNMSSQTHCE